MALQVTDLKRVFKLDNDGKVTNLSDPNPNMAPADVAKFYAGSYPELTTASLEGPKVVGDEAEYTFSLNVGTKG